MLDWPTINEEDLKPSDDVPKDYAFQGIAQKWWTLVQQHLGLAEKYHGCPVLDHNCWAKNVLPSWSVGVSQVSSLMIPSSTHEAYCDLVRRQASEHLEFMETALNHESSFSLKVAAVQSVGRQIFRNPEQWKNLPTPERPCTETSTVTCRRLWPPHFWQGRIEPRH